MKRKVLASLLVIAVVAGLVGASTWAYFTSTATSADNTFTAGTAVISLGGDVSGGDAYFAVDNMAPGDTESACVAVMNDGSLDLLFRGYVANVTQDPAGFIGQLQVTITLRHPDCATPGDYLPYGPGPGSEGYPLEIYSGPLSGYWGVGNATDNIEAVCDNGNLLDPPEPLWPGYAAVYKVEVELPWTTSNDWQGATFTGDMVFDAVQFENQTCGAIVW